jgi:hypothetical protein
MWSASPLNIRFTITYLLNFQRILIITQANPQYSDASSRSAVSIIFASGVVLVVVDVAL